MAEQLSIHLWCDLCLEEGRKEPAEYRKFPITLGHGPPLGIDLCELHHKQLLQPVLEVLARHGIDLTARPKERQRGWRRNTGPYKCHAGCDAAPLKNATTFEVHLRKLHGMTLDDYVSRYGDLVPLTAEEQAELVVEVECEVEGCGTAYSTARGNRWPQQAMISHMRGRHGLNWRPGQSLKEATRVGP